jgi:hypothetical protein
VGIWPHFILLKQLDNVIGDLITVIVGEAANFVAYVFAPAVLVTPLGAMTIIVR